MKKLLHILLALTLQGSSFLGFYSFGQNPISSPDAIQNQDSTLFVSDTVVSDTIVKTDTIPVPQGDVETTIVYSARDSIRMDVVNQVVYLYGDAKIDYGDISLSAGEIEIDWGTNTLTARPAIDSLGNKVEIPVFKDEDATYVVQNYVKYNFKTRKGLSSGVVTQQGEGFIHGETIKKVNDNLYISSAQYTTCNLAHPHFYINATKLKVIPEDKVVSGPFNLVISDVPTPLGFILGFFPIPKKEKSGIIFPTGGSSTRGFFLRNGGYYWAAGEHLGVRVVGDAYANGSYRASLNASYITRYRFSGSASINYSRNRFGFEENVGFDKNINFTWNHRTLARKNSSLNADVNAGSSNYYKQNSYNPTILQQGTFRSSVSYYKTFANSPFTLSLAMRQDQSVTSGIANYTLPDATFAMNRIYPFRRKNAVGPKRLYENINVSYTLNAQSRFTNDTNRVGGDTILAFNADNLPFLLSKAEYGARHTIPVSTTFKPTKTFLKYFNITPSLVYNEVWYPQKLDYSWNPATRTMETDTIKGFSRAYNYSGSTNISTTIYGMYRFNSKKLLGIRHTLIPNVGYTFMPDFTKGNYQTVQVDTFNNVRTLSRYAGFMYGGPGQGVSSNLSFNINNSFEAKVASKKDTVTGVRKLKLIDQLNIIGSYNFAAERNNLSVITASARTRLFERFDIATSASFDPYIYKDSTDSRDKKYNYRSNSFAIKNKQGLAKITDYRISIGANLNPKIGTVKKSNQGTEAELREVNLNPFMYVDFNIPWTLFISYNINYSKLGSDPSKLVQALTFNGDIRISEKWKIAFNSGFDIVLKTFTTTSINVYRDLHCWQMSFNVIPFGPQRSYGFSISAKSSLLQDLKLNKKSPGYFGGF